MPLDVASLTLSVRTAMTAQRTVQNQAAMARLWAQVFEDYFLLAVVPPPLPTRPVLLDAARDAAIAVMSVSTFASGLTDMATVATLFAAAIAGSSISIVVPPPAPFVPVGSIAGIDAAAAAFAATLDTWARTGTSTIPPSPPIPWT